MAATPAARVMLGFASVTAAILCALWVLPAPVDSAPVARLALPFTAVVDAEVEAAVLRTGSTQYHGYRTVRIGRIERPAHLLTGQRRWTRELTVPAGGARYEVFVGSIGASATVRLGRRGGPASDTSVTPDEWTKVTFDLDRRAGLKQTVAIEIGVEPGGVAAWGSELVIANRPDKALPDVVLISLDTVRRDQLTPYSPSLPTTPMLAALAREALVFDEAISTSSWTIGSHSNLFTGRFLPDSLGYQSRVEPEEFTLPEILAASGYRTFGVSGGPYTDPRWGLHQGFDEYVASAERENARAATTRAIDWMSQAGAAPVFVFLNFFDAHEPLALSDDVRRATGVSADIPGPLWSELDTGRRPVTSGIRAQLTAAYRAELTAIDLQLQRLTDYLKRSGRWDRTLLIIWSDHGQLLGERGYVGHAFTLDEELLRIPLMIKPPMGSALGPGSYRGLIQGDDLFPLTQALAGLPSADGAAILTALSRHTPVRRLAFSKIHHEPLPELVAHRRWRSATLWSVHDGSTKIVRTLEGQSAAYHVSGGEEKPSAMPDPSSPLITALDRFRSWPGHRRSAPTVGPLSPAERERLRSLGYIQ